MDQAEFEPTNNQVFNSIIKENHGLFMISISFDL